MTTNNPGTPRGWEAIDTGDLDKQHLQGVDISGLEEFVEDRAGVGVKINKDQKATLPKDLADFSTEQLEDLFQSPKPGPNAAEKFSEALRDMYREILEDTTGESANGNELGSKSLEGEALIKYIAKAFPTGTIVELSEKSSRDPNRPKKGLVTVPMNGGEDGSDSKIELAIPEDRTTRTLTPNEFRSLVLEFDKGLKNAA